MTTPPAPSESGAASGVESASIDRESGQRRLISGPSALGICIASMIGSGIFTVTGFIGPELVSTRNLMAAWVIGGLVALCGGLSVAELAAMRPRASAQYVVVHDALGAGAGYLKGMITLLIGYVSSLAAVALVTGEYLQQLAPAIDPRITATAVLTALSLVHARTVLGGQRINDILVAFKLLLVVGFIGVGFVLMGEPLLPSAELLDAARRLDPTSPLGAIPAGTAGPQLEALLRGATGPGLLSGAVGLAVVSISFAYLGWSTAAEVAGEVRRPQRNLPLAIIGSVLLVGTLYLLINIVYLRVIPPVAMVELGAGGELVALPAIGSTVAQHLLGERGGSFVTIALIGLFVSTLSTGTMTGGRIFAAMSWKGQLPAPLGRLNEHGAPTRAILVMLAITLTMVWSSSLASLFEYVGLLTTIAMMLAMVSVIVLRRRSPDLPRPFRVPLYPIPPLISLGIGSWLVASAVQRDWQPVAATAGTIIAITLLRPVLTRTVSAA
ncbi:MAG: APC family permease [Planctomycetota bacterium]